jgi:phosphonate transport system ATP-binding protein
VALGRLLRQEPVLLLADEPLASLDPRLAAELLQLLLEEGRAPRALLLSLHRPDLLEGFDRVVGLRGGRLQFDRPRQEVDSGLLASLYAGSEPMASEA